MPPTYRSRGRGGLSTTQRGYDGEHRKARAKALAQLQDGEPCPFCSRPMFREQDLDYDHAIPLAEGGRGGPRRLSHASCNRSAGAKLGNRLRRTAKRPVSSPAVPQAAAPVPGAPCYGCGHPMDAGQALRSAAAGYGDQVVWSHVRCLIRHYSVPVDRL